MEMQRVYRSWKDERGQEIGWEGNQRQKPKVQSKKKRRTRASVYERMNARSKQRQRERESHYRDAEEQKSCK